MSLVLAALLSACSKGERKPEEALTIYGAASTTDVMTELAKRWSARTGTTVRTNFASSATVAKQIEAGARADIYISANVGWMDHLESKGLLEPGSRKDLLTNRLVVIAPASQPFDMRIAKGADFAGAFQGKLALADPAHAPAGKYAREALEHFGWWESLGPRILPAKDVRAVVAAVETGSVGAGVVYATDAAVSKRVKLVATFPEDAHPFIRFPMALVKGARSHAPELLQFLEGGEAREVYERAGFHVLVAR